MLSILCIAFPPLFGEGYSSIRKLEFGEINSIIHDSLFRSFASPEFVIIVFLALATLFKAFATSITLHSGGNGGNFAPSLIAGGLLGYWFGYTLTVLGFPDVPVTNLMLVGMAGVMAGALYAPLTAIFLIAESSSGYDLFIPLMIVSVMSYLMNRYFSTINPDLKKLADEGKIFTTRHDRNILMQIDLQKCLNYDAPSINIKARGEDLIAAFRTTTQNTIAVVNDENIFWGIITREQILSFLNGSEPPEKLRIADTTTNPSFRILPSADIMTAMKMLDEADAWTLPVVDEHNKYIGLVSKFEILNQYRLLLKDLSIV